MDIPKLAYRIKFALVAMAITIVAFSPAQAMEMGSPGFVPDRGDFTAAASVGFRNLILLDSPVVDEYDAIRSFEIRAKFGYQMLEWLGLQGRIGGGTYNRNTTGFKGFFGALYGLMLSIDPIVDYEGFSMSIVGGTELQPVKGTVGAFTDLKAKKLDTVAGLRFSYCLERACAYIGGRYTYLSIWEDRSARTIIHTGGVFGGVDYYVTPNIFFGLEAQNFDGDAIYGAVGGRF